jgi:DNA-binding MarR family transcriptional regulator
MAKRAISASVRASPRKRRDASVVGAASQLVLDLTYLEGTIGYTIRRAQLVIFKDIYGAFGDKGISTAQFSVLAVAADNPGVTQAELAVALGVERPRIVPLIDFLESQGLAVRVSSTTDGRQRQIHLTKKGERLLADLKRRFAEHQQRLFDALGPHEATALLRSLRRVFEHFKSDDG